MASVYKTVSKKNLQQPAAEREPEDVEMEDLLAEADDTSDSEDEEEEEEEQGGANGNGKNGEDLAKKNAPFAGGQLPKTRVLMLTSRGVTYRYFLPHLHYY